MKYCKLANDNSEFINIQSNDDTLPLIAACKISGDLYLIDEPEISNKLNIILGSTTTGETTEETNYVKQINDVLGVE